MATLWRPCGCHCCHSALLPCHCLLSACSATPALLPCHSTAALPCPLCTTALPLLPEHCCPATAPPHCPVCSATVPLISIVAASRRTVANRKSAANCSIMHKQQSLQRLGERLSLYGIFYGEDCSLFGVSSKSAYYFYCCCCCCYCSTSASSKDCNIMESLLRHY